jgi:hypothetical protein
MSKDEWIAMFRELMDIGRGTGPAERPLRSTPSDWNVPTHDDGVAPKPDDDADPSAELSP